MFITSKEIRSIFLNYFFNNDHIIKESSSLIPKKDSNLLFTNAGMIQFKDYFLGIKKSRKNFVSIQHCLRINGKNNDLNNVGNTLRHNTFFEMMGNFSFGLYYKKDAIFYSWDLLTNKSLFGLSKDRLFVTVHKKDIESYNIWLNIIKIPKQHIFILGDSNLNSENFWFIDNLGLCGYSTEIFYDLIGSNSKISNNYFLKNNNSRFLEIWNLVFMEFILDKKLKLNILSNKCIDTGMGFERITSILQNVSSNFDIDIFLYIKSSISNILGIKININNLNIFNIISDHIRSIIYLIFYGILPSNEYRGYVLRKIIRRTLLYIRFLKFNDIVLYKIIKFLLTNKNEFILLNISDFNYFIDIVLYEEKKFFKTLYCSLNLLNFYISKFKSKKYLSSNIVFMLYDTYGLPIDLLIDVCNYNNICINLNKFKLKLENHKKLSRKNIKINYNKNFSFIINFLNNVNSTLFLGFKKKSIISKVLLVFNNIKYFNVNNKYIYSIVLDKTIFYPKCSGQSYDIGYLKSLNNKSKFIVNKTLKINNYILHIGYFKYGKIFSKDKVKCVYNIDNRNLNSINHSCLHILCYVMNNFNRCFLKNSTKVNSKKFILDFNCDKINKLNIIDIEKEVNLIIWKNIDIKEKIFIDSKLYNKFSFKFLGKNIVRKIYLDNIYSEYCSGTHVKNTKYIKLFVIKKFYNISSNIKRLVCLTNLNSFKYIYKFKDILYNLSYKLKFDIKNIYNNIIKIIDNYKKLKNINSNLILSLKINLINFFSEKYLYIFKNYNFYLYKYKLINFLNKSILFYILNYLYNKYNLSLIIFNILLKNKDYYVILLNKLILNILGFNFLDKIKFYLLNKKYIIKNFYIFKNDKFYVNIFSIIENKNIDKFFIFNKILNFIKKRCY